MEKIVYGAILASLSTAAFAQSTAGLTGAFVHMGYSATDEVITVSQLPAFLDELQDLGNDTIIVGPTRTIKNGAGCADSASDFEWVKGFPSKLGPILDAAKARGMKVVVGTTLSRGCGQFWGSGNTAAVESDTGQAFAAIAATYGSHTAFHGWYIPDEPGPVPSNTYDYYRRISNKLKSLLPAKPVMVAPYLGSPSTTPSALADDAEDFRNATGINVQIWQDGIGANPNAKLWHWSRPGYSTEQYFQALAAKLGASGLWADVELFNFGDPLFLQTGTGLSGAYRSASAMRLNQQLYATRQAGKRVSWLHEWHMSEYIGPGKGYVEEPRMMGVYRGFYGLGGSLVFPNNHSNYTWLTAPSANYPDSTGNELFNRQTGDPRNPQDPAWIGVNGAATVRIDIGTSKRIDWIGIHTLTYPSWGIRTPVSADLYCGASSSSLSKIATLTAPFTQASLSASAGEEYVLGNRTPLDATCRFVELRFANGNWTFVSEIEASAE